MKKVAMKDKAIDHRLFLASRAEWIRQHNEEPVKTKLSNKTDLKKVQESLQTTQRTGGRFEKPEMEFVCEEDWDSDDGEYDKSKVVEAEVFGALKKGIWKVIGKKGHYKYTGYEDKEVQHNKIEDDGTGLFAAEAIRAKKAALLEGHAGAEKVRNDNAVQAKKSTSMTDLLAVLKKHGAVADDALGAGDEDNCAKTEKHTSDSGSDISESSVDEGGSKKS